MASLRTARQNSLIPKVLNPSHQSLDQLFKSGFQLRTGFVPVYKPRGVCCDTIKYNLQNDIEHYVQLNTSQTWLHPVDYVCNLNPFADGILTFTLGNSRHYSKSLILSEYVHKMRVEFGTQRQFECLDGKIILSNQPIDHVNSLEIRLAARTFVGLTPLMRQKKIDMCERTSLDGEPSDPYLHDYSRIYWRQPRYPGPQTQHQKYPFHRPMLNMRIDSMKLLDYTPPYASFEIVSQGGVSFRSLVTELCNKLNTCGSIVELTRTKEGPAKLDETRVFELHELNTEYLFPRISGMQSHYLKYLNCWQSIAGLKSGDRYSATREPRLQTTEKHN